jgi:adenosylcobinamide-phosphate synthase
VSRRSQLAFGLVVGTALDSVVRDPRRGHPVAAFGTAAGALERGMWADSKARGAAFTALCVGSTVLVGRLVERRSGRARVFVVAAGTWTVLGSGSLRAEAAAVGELLEAGDLPAARQRVTNLVGRDPAALDDAGLARAAVESVAENTCDAVVAPLLWGAIAGVPGLLGYRAVNTLDAMVGHRSVRYARFGWAAARLDDVANALPARITAGLVAVVAPTVGGDPRRALQTAARDGRAHPSPNSGVSEAAFAGALGLRLGGRNVYQGRPEDRPVLGDGAAPGPGDIYRANRLCAGVTLAAAAVAAVVARR